MTRSRQLQIRRFHCRWPFRQEAMPESVDEEKEIKHLNNCLVPRRKSGEAAHESDYEQISTDTPNVGKISMHNLSFSNQQLAKSQHKALRHLASAQKRVLMLVTNRDKSMPLYYVLLRMASLHFWSTVIAVQLALTLFGAITFVGVAGQHYGLAVALALDVNSLSVGDIECSADGYYGKFVSIGLCRAWATVLRLIHFVQLLFIGGIIVVRLSRVIAKHRFEFSKKAVLQDDELCIRICSNRPAMVIAPTFRLEYFDFKGRAHPLELVNGGALAYLHDAAVYLRHKVTANNSPFFDSNWRQRVYKMRVAVSGFDELLAQDVTGIAMYHQPDILDDAKFADMMFRAKLKLTHDSPPRTLLCSDMSKLDEVEFIEKDPEAPRLTTTADNDDDDEDDGGGVHHVAQLDALTEDDLQLKIAPATEDQVGIRPGIGPRALTLLNLHTPAAPTPERKSLATVMNSAVAEFPTITQNNTETSGRRTSFFPSSRRNKKKAWEGKDPATVCLSQLHYADRQMIAALIASETTPQGLLLMVTNRRGPVPWNYLFLRMRAHDFWTCVISVWVVLALFAAILFKVVAGQPVVDAVLLSLDAHSLSIGDVYCKMNAYNGYGWLLCRFVALGVRLNVFICELFFGALIIVRLSRVVVHDRFRFSNFCVITKHRKELVLRLVSNRPSSVVLPSFILEYMDSVGKRLHPLELTTAGATAYLNDSTFFLRHRIDESSPFYHADWRERVLGVRVAVMGHDSLLAAEACGVRYYTALEIRDDVDFGDMVSLACLRFKKLDHQAYLVDMRKLNLVKERSSSFSAEEFKSNPTNDTYDASSIERPRLESGSTDNFSEVLLSAADECEPDDD